MRRLHEAWALALGAAAGLALALALVGVAPPEPPVVISGRRDPPPMPAPGLWTKRAAPEGARDAELEALEAIGYLGGTEPPAAAGGVAVDDPRAWRGLNLVTSGHAAEAWLMTMAGETIHSWAMPFEAVWPDRVVDEARPEHQFWRRVHLLPDGALLAIYEGFGLIKLSRDGALIWAWPGGAHHDLEVLGDGRIWVLSRRGRYLPALHEKPILEDFATLLTPGGVELRRVSVLEAVLASDTRSLYEASRKRHGDVFHTNSLAALDRAAAAHHPAFQPGRLLLSSRTLSAIFVLDPDTGAIPWWRTGGWRQQHDPQVLPSGELMLFDNVGAPGERSQVRVFDLATMEQTWGYGGAEAPLYSRFLGAAQRLPNGNTLITESSPGRALEVTAEGEIVWAYQNPHRAGEGGEYVAILPEVLRLPAGYAGFGREAAR